MQSHGRGRVCTRARQRGEVAGCGGCRGLREEAGAGMLLECPGSWLAQRYSLALSLWLMGICPGSIWALRGALPAPSISTTSVPTPSFLTPSQTHLSKRQITSHSWAPQVRDNSAWAQDEFHLQMAGTPMASTCKFQCVSTSPRVGFEKCRFLPRPSITNVFQEVWGGAQESAFVTFSK